VKFFLDTAFVEEIRAAKEWGILDGVTTNPTLVAKTGKGFMEVVQDILNIVEGPVSIEVVAQDAQGMVEQAQQLRRLGEQVVIKIPATQEGIKAVKVLSQEGIPTNVTLIFQPLQALLAAKAGATYVSPFVGRLEDIGHDAMDLVFDIKNIFESEAYQQTFPWLVLPHSTQTTFAPSLMLCHESSRFFVAFQNVLASKVVCGFHHFEFLYSHGEHPL